MPGTVLSLFDVLTYSVNKRVTKGQIIGRQSK